MEILSPRVFGRWRRLVRRFCLVGLLFLLGSASPGAPAAAAGSRGSCFDASQVKAVFIYNLLHFVYWPPAAPAHGKRYRIVVLGDRKIADNLRLLTANESFQGCRVTVGYCRRAEDVGECRILFVSSGYQSEMAAIRRRLARKPVLLAGDGEGFLAAGGMVRLATKNHRITLEIDPAAARRVGITFNARLLRVARIVEPSQ